MPKAKFPQAKEFSFNRIDNLMIEPLAEEKEEDYFKQKEKKEGSSTSEYIPSSKSSPDFKISKTSKFKDLVIKPLEANMPVTKEIGLVIVTDSGVENSVSEGGDTRKSKQGSVNFSRAYTRFKSHIFEMPGIQEEVKQEDTSSPMPMDKLSASPSSVAVSIQESRESNI